jgi:serine/threonine-protein kinase
VYALGITLYELLAGQRPFNSRGKPEYLVLDAHVNELPEPPTVYRYGIPQPIVDAVMRSLAKEPDARFQSADEFMRALPDVGAPSAATPRVDPSRTVALEYSPSMSGDSAAARAPSHTMAFEYTSSTGQVPGGSMAFDYSAATLRQESYLRGSPPSPAATASPASVANVAAAETPGTASLPDTTTPSPPASFPASSHAAQPLRWSLRAYRPVIVAVLLATPVLGTLVRYAARLHAAPPSVSLATSVPRDMHAQASTPTQAPTPTEPAAPPPAAETSLAEPAAAPSTELASATAVPAAGTTAVTTAATARQDLSGTWRGEYVDTSGKQLLRVVSLSISRVHDDGGIEGTLQYEAASGVGECKLHPRGSAYSASEQRLQLSPEGCSPHYPKELAVPLDFDGVNPRANTLNDGRIEAPTGDVIRVKLKRVSGV